jgi:hypothetical protein
VPIDGDPRFIDRRRVSNWMRFSGIRFGKKFPLEGGRRDLVAVLRKTKIIDSKKERQR